MTPWRLTTIVSGADRGAIEAGVELGLRVQGWHTEIELRGAALPAPYTENAKPTLSPRMAARLNVQDSDGTLILSVAAAVPSGAHYADEAIDQQRKPSLHVVLPAGGASTIPDDVVTGVLDWLREEKIHILHVTGPTERDEPGVQQAVRDALVWIFEDDVAGCTCDVGRAAQIVHEGDCPMRCSFWRRDYHSEQVAQCAMPAGHGGKHQLNLYRGSPSVRAERGRAWPVPVPHCSEAAPLDQWRCQYYYLDPDNHCTLQSGHREHHTLVSGVTNAEGAQ